jgi:hypothetical protein
MNRKLFLALLFGFYPMSALAFPLSYCPIPGSEGTGPEQTTCGQCESQLLADFDALLTEIKDQPRSWTMDEFLGRLPAALRKDFILMGKSASLQSASPEFPRVILKSPDAEVILSFASSPKHSGFSKIEAMVWRSPKFEMIEVDFPAELGREGFAKVQKNPAHCVGCHGANPRPIWESYPHWPGQIPFQQDILVGGRTETSWYLRALERMEKQESRWKHLLPTTSAQRVRNLTEGQRLFLPHSASVTSLSPFDGPGTALADQLRARVMCQWNHSLLADPEEFAARKKFYSDLENCYECRERLDESLPDGDPEAGFTKQAHTAWESLGITSRQKLTEFLLEEEKTRRLTKLQQQKDFLQANDPQFKDSDLLPSAPLEFFPPSELATLLWYAGPDKVSPTIFNQGLFATDFPVLRPVNQFFIHNRVLERKLSP